MNPEKNTVSRIGLGITSLLSPENPYCSSNTADLALRVLV